jgi:hypothetical protein
MHQWMDVLMTEPTCLPELQDRNRLTESPLEHITTVLQQRQPVARDEG